MAQVRLARSRVDLLDTDVRTDPARNLVLLSWGPIDIEMSYQEALVHHQRLGVALKRLRSVEFGPAEPTGEGVVLSRDVTEVRSSAGARSADVTTSRCGPVSTADNVERATSPISF